MATPDERVRERIEGAVETIRRLLDLRAEIATIGAAVGRALENGGTVYTCGNGGSAAEALHLAEELVGRYRDDRPPLPAVCLNADPTALTCIANDYAFDEVFARQAQALVRKGDALVVFSTSGKSPNVARALSAAREKGAATIALLGKSGGECLALADHALVVPSDDTAHIQEAHQVALHLILELVESAPSL